MTELLVEKQDRILTLTLNRPERLNALSENMRAGLLAELEAAERDPEVRVIVITGAGRGFCSGGDVKAMNERLNAGTNERAWEDVLNPTRDDTQLQMRKTPKVIIAAVNGVAAGAGFSIALGCDIRICSDRATFLQAFVKRGNHPDWGSTYFLPRVTGVGPAMELLCTGDTIDAAEAYRLGIVNHVFPAESFAEETAKFARRFADGPTVAIGLIKASVYANLERDLKGGLQQESLSQIVVRRSEDYAEGIRAFAEKRPPNYQGR